MPYLSITDRDGIASQLVLGDDDREIYIGRHPGCALLLDVDGVAPFHCQLSRVNGDFVLRAEPDSAGFAVAGVPQVEQRLRDGDTVAIAGVALTFHAGTAGPNAAGAGADAPAEYRSSSVFDELGELSETTDGLPAQSGPIARAHSTMRAHWPVVIGVLLAAAVYLQPTVKAEPTTTPPPFAAAVAAPLVEAPLGEAPLVEAPLVEAPLVAAPAAPSVAFAAIAPAQATGLVALALPLVPQQAGRTRAKVANTRSSAPTAAPTPTAELLASRASARELIRRGLMHEGADDAAEAIRMWREAQSLLAADDELHQRASRLLRELGVADRAVAEDNRPILISEQSR